MTAQNPNSGNFVVEYDDAKAEYTIHLLEWHRENPILQVSPAKKDTRAPYIRNVGYDASGDGGVWDHRLLVKADYGFHFVASTGSHYRLQTSEPDIKITIEPEIVTFGVSDSSVRFKAVALTATIDGFGDREFHLDKGSRLLITNPHLDPTQDFKASLVVGAGCIHDPNDGTKYDLHGYTYNTGKVSDSGGRLVMQPERWRRTESSVSTELTIPSARNSHPATTLQSFVITAVPCNPELAVLTSDPQIRLATVDPGGKVLVGG